MRDFRKLRIWQESMILVKEVYNYCKGLPDTEKFGLISQMQRAGVSIPSNIAEGCSRSSEREFKRFLEIALGSAFELETQLILTGQLYNIDEEQEEHIIDMLHQVQRQMNSLIQKIAKA